MVCLGGVPCRALASVVFLAPAPASLPALLGLLRWKKEEREGIALLIVSSLQWGLLWMIPSKVLSDFQGVGLAGLDCPEGDTDYFL